MSHLTPEQWLFAAADAWFVEHPDLPVSASTTENAFLALAERVYWQVVEARAAR